MNEMNEENSGITVKQCYKHLINEVIKKDIFV